jgi:hypothetical protein
MAKAPQNEKPITSADIELHVDAWTRFERAAGAVTKAPPQHRKKKKSKNLGKVETKPIKAKKSKNDRTRTKA